jgi:aspartate 1-decarboxylase
MLKSKIHRATVTGADVDHEGSITIDQELMEAARLVEEEVLNHRPVLVYVDEKNRVEEI